MDYGILDGYLSGEEGVEEPEVYAEEDPEVLAALASAPARPPAPTPTARGGILRFQGRGRKTRRGRRTHKAPPYRGGARGRGGPARGGRGRARGSASGRTIENVRLPP